MNVKLSLKHGLFLFLILLGIGILNGLLFKPIFLLSKGYPSPRLWINTVLAIIILIVLPFMYGRFNRLTKKDWLVCVIFIMILTNIFNFTSFYLPRPIHESTNYVFDYAIDAFPPAQYSNTVCFMHQVRIVNGLESKCLFVQNEKTNYFLYALNNIVLYAVFLMFLIIGSSLNKDQQELANSIKRY